MIRWVFWDLGDTLLNEDRLRFTIWEKLHATLLAAGRSGDFHELMKDREHLAEAGDPSPHYTLAKETLPAGEFETWKTSTAAFVRGEGQFLISAVPAAAEALRQLSARLTHGIIADQPMVVLETLDRLKLRRWFAFEGLSERAGLNKPDPAFYRWALESTGCEPDQAVMVGDRVDRDAEPALGVGMTAVLCYLPPWEKGWLPDTPNGRIYIDSLARVPNWFRPRGGSRIPTFSTLDDVARYVEALE